MKRKSIIFIISVLVLVILVSFFYVRKENKKNIENKISQEMLVIEEDGLVTEQNEAYVPQHLQGKYGRTYDKETHILTFYIDGEKVNEVDLFEVAPITMEGRDNLESESIPEKNIGYNPDDRYTTLSDDNERFGVKKEIGYLSLSIGAANRQYYKYEVVEYRYRLYLGNSDYIGTMYRSLVINSDGVIEKELVIKENVTEELFVIDSIHPELRYVAFVISPYGYETDDNEFVRHVILETGGENLLEKIFENSEYGYYQHNRLMFNIDGKIILEHNEVKNLDSGCIELDFDFMKINVLEDCSNT